MQKSFKKAIACLLAVLMVAFAMPFSAFAAVGDYEPDIQLQFSPFFETMGSDSGTSATGYTMGGLAAFPLNYNNGTLSATVEDINALNDYWGDDLVEEGWTLGEGDFFVVTVRMDNIDIAATGNVLIRFSDNITPAGYWQTGKGKNAKYGFSTEENKPAGATALVGYLKSIDAWSATDIYTDDGTLDGEKVFNTAVNLNGIKEDPAAVDGDGWSDYMIRANFVGEGDYVDVSSVNPANGFFDIENHTFDAEDGYTYDGKFIIASFAFQITGDGPIEFALQDPEGTIDTDLSGASYFAKKSEGLATENATTYAPNGENPGSMKMTFMGKNENKGGEDPQTTTYTVTFLDKDGEQISSTSYEENADVTIPELPANTYDDNNHYTYAWNAEPSAKATADATYQVVETAAKHEFDEGVIDPQSTCTTKGTKTFTCACGKQYTEEVDLADHTPGTAARENEIPATCTAEGSYNEVVRCTECNTIISSTPKTIGKLDHTPGAAARENEIPATCKAEGSYNEVVRCTECNTVISSTPKTIGKLDHTPSEPVDENIKPATKKDAGTKDIVVYCSECGEVISRETVETEPALGVTVTLNKSDIGTVDGLEIGANKLAYGTDIALTATPVEGAKFVGWEIGGNIVSQEATYTTKAAYDFTITPVFEDVAAETITVTFYDKYGNTIKQYKDVAVEAYRAAIAVEYDAIEKAAPTYPSYEFAGWDKDKNDILTLDASTTIWATYTKVEETVVPKYTVTTNAELILPDGITYDQIPYDTKVTVRDAAATAWMVGDTTVAYGTEYSFYVGSDVTINPVYAPVVEEATTTVIGANLVAGSNYKYNIVATRNVPDSFTLVDYGFVYGKNLTDTELNLDLVGNIADSGATIKAVHAGTRNTESNEFAFNYGIKAMDAPITAKSFVIVINTDGETEIIYSDMFTQNYNND
jgi:hypothetical protein